MKQYQAERSNEMPSRRGTCSSCKRKRMIIFSKGRCATCWRREDGIVQRQGRNVQMNVVEKEIAFDLNEWRRENGLPRMPDADLAELFAHGENQLLEAG
jgi:hypothetical protein